MRAEGLGGVLAGLAIAVPTVHRRLQDALPGRGRKTAIAAAQGSKQAFHLGSTLVDEQKQVGALFCTNFETGQFMHVANQHLETLTLCLYDLSDQYSSTPVPDCLTSDWIDTLPVKITI